MKVLVIGAHGKTGMRVTRRLAEHDTHAPLAMIRHPDQRPAFDEIGVPTVLGDLEYPIDHAVRGCEAVIFAAGSGGKTGKDKTVLVDRIGAIRSMVAAAVHGARRYVMLSALNATVDAVTKITHYHRAKAHADQFLRHMHEVMEDEHTLDWTTVHPGGLLDEPGTGEVEVGDEIVRSGQTTRDDLAATLVACLDEPRTIGKSFALVQGQTPIADALKSL